jgi:UDP-N-acetylglucosamine 1-carboxyvinyltransferase
MGSFIVEGKRKLQGEITVSGNKNEALPLVAAALLSDQPVHLDNIPDIGDLQGMYSIARELGAQITKTGENAITIHAGKITRSTLSVEFSSKIRGSILFSSSLLVRTGMACIPQPGGDSIGRRRVDSHFLVFEALGAVIDIKRERVSESIELLTYVIRAEHGLKGADIYLDEASVTATENALIAASGARGVTVINNAASEPHVQGLCRFLQSMGVSIEGIGSNVLTVRGIEKFKSVTYTVGSDYIEAGSFIGLAAATNSQILIKNVDIKQLRMILYQFDRLGVHVIVDHEKRTIHVPENQGMIVKRDFGNAIPRIDDSPWPGFPADLTSILLVTATQSDGTCLIHEKMFESRLFFVDKLIAMGAQIVLCDPHRAVIVGPSRLYGATISSPDIRAGMALLIAALAAEGKSTINNIEQIDRGYESIDVRLNALGAKIERVTERRRNVDVHLL